jgi:hypothetical protein
MKPEKKKGRNIEEGADVELGSQSDRKPRKSTPHSGAIKPMRYVWISAAGLVFTVALLALYIWKAKDLIQQGIDKQVFYILLIPLGLSACALLFGAMGSYASYKGEALSGTLKLSGPAVGVALIVIGGFWLVPSTDTFNMTVRPLGPNGEKISKGLITLALGQDNRTVPLAPNGEANFKEIPQRFLNQEVSVYTEIEGYRLADSQLQVTLTHSITLTMVEDSSATYPTAPDTFNVTARVFDPAGLPVTTGSVTLYLGPDLREAPIARNGEANFKSVPMKFQGKKAGIRVDVPGYEMVPPQEEVPLGELVTIRVRARNNTGRKPTAPASRIIQQSHHSSPNRN